MKNLNIILISLALIFVFILGFIISDVYFKNKSSTSSDSYNQSSDSSKKAKNESAKQPSGNKTGQQNKQINNTQSNTALDSVSTYETSTPIPQLLEKYAGSELLGRPTANSITINIIAPEGMQAYFEYGISSGSYSQKSLTLTSSKGVIETTLSNLLANTKYYYRTSYKLSGESSFKTGIEHSFATQRPQGTTFTFDLQADPHMDGHSEPEVYKSTLQTEAADNPDFVIDLGDTFMTEKFATTQEQVERRYLEQRSYLDIFGSSAPLFLANGNHEGEFGWLFNSVTKDNNAYWALDARKLYYPNPIPDNFYTGSSDGHENYYSFTWGDALFVVLDPYTYSTEFRKQTGDMWDSTIGDEQYQWFKETLENSNAKYKFVFMHHMLGEFRGMTNWADKYEWGGENNNGVYEFNNKRPTWELPIHQLMVKNNVDIFFQGHDHLYSTEEKDGIIYQEVAQPSTLHGDPAPGTEGQYLGEVLTSPGYMRIKVSPQNVSVEYVKILASGSSEIADSYVVK
jgi:predicted phosphodiesterase